MLVRVVTGCERAEWGLCGVGGDRTGRVVRRGGKGKEGRREGGSCTSPTASCGDPTRAGCCPPHAPLFPSSTLLNRVSAPIPYITLHLIHTSVSCTSARSRCSTCKASAALLAPYSTRACCSCCRTAAGVCADWLHAAATALSSTALTLQDSRHGVSHRTAGKRQGQDRRQGTQQDRRHGETI